VKDDELNTVLVNGNVNVHGNEVVGRNGNGKEVTGIGGNGNRNIILFQHTSNAVAYPHPHAYTQF